MTSVPSWPKHVVMYADGASRGNPGPASFGVVVQDDKGQLVAEWGEAIGDATNNVAEYSGMLSALQHAVAHNVAHVQIKLDSELVVKQMLGLYRVKSEGLLPLYQKAMTLQKKFQTFAIAHVPRAQNARADALANKALDRS